MSNLNRNIEKISNDYFSSPKGKKANRNWILWDLISLINVRNAINKKELEIAFLAAPSGGKSEKEAILIFLKNKGKEGFE